ncbi:SH3 domain-containing protein [Flavobacterium alkalisoli]|uniref:SH3 domain-containing protein n=1 Tax=Flavobacterium alkalisoli TaxID=2602769 RepID=UPI003A91E9B8
MNRLLFFLILLTGITVNAQDSKLIASCCGKCTGSAYCTACKNCTGCKHCSKEGGSCGVCESKSKPKAEKNNFSSDSSDEVTILTVIPAELNLYSGPGTNYKVLEKLKKGSSVVVIAYSGDWVKVKAVNSRNTGYVLLKDVR